MLGYLSFFTITVLIGCYQTQAIPCNKACVRGTVCRIVYDAEKGLESQCLKKPPKFSTKGVCPTGEPLLQTSSAGLGFAFCGRGSSRIDCPDGYHCIIEPADRYAVCCADDDSTIEPFTSPLKKPGTCPAPKTLSCKGSCSSDQDCPDDQKCCKHACGGSQCSDPAPPSCKTVANETCFLKTQKCPKGEICELRQVMCFAAPCPLVPTCVPATSKKPRKCPKHVGGTSICLFDPSRNCVEDSECSEGQKCCPAGCNKLCKSVVTSDGEEDNERPGECPAPSGLAGICVLDPDVNCEEDFECPEGHKCCSDGCGKICKPLVTPTQVSTTQPVNGCPVISDKMKARCLTRQHKCSVKKVQSCPKGQVCCRTLCGSACFIPS